MVGPRALGWLLLRWSAIGPDQGRGLGVGVVVVGVEVGQLLGDMNGHHFVKKSFISLRVESVTPYCWELGRIFFSFVYSSWFQMLDELFLSLQDTLQGR